MYCTLFETRPREVKSPVVSPLVLEIYQETFRELTVACHDRWWLFVRAEDQARVERLALARATKLAGHKASLTRFDALWSEEFNTIASDDKFCAARPGIRAKRPLPFAFRSILVPGSPLLRQPPPLCPFATALTLRIYQTGCDGYKICREWSCSHDKCSDPSPCQLSHVCIRRLQPHRLPCCTVLQKREADRATRKARATGSYSVAAARGRHTLPRRQLMIPVLWRPSWLLMSLWRNPEIRRLQVAA